MRWKKKLQSWKCCGIYYISMVDIRRETYESNCVEIIVHNDGILKLNENHIVGLDYKNLRVTIKYLSDHRKQIY